MTQNFGSPTSGGATGTFLDDGREIKTKVVRSDVMSTYYVHTPHGLDATKILNYETVLIHGNNSTITSSKGNGGRNLKFLSYISSGKCSLILDDESDIELLVNSKCVASTTITYLA